VIPRRLHGWEKFTHQFKVAGNEIANRIDVFSAKFGLTIIPGFIRYGLVIIVCLAPCFAIISACIFGDDEEDDPKIVKDLKEKKNQTKEEAKTGDKK